MDIYAAVTERIIEQMEQGIMGFQPPNCLEHSQIGQGYFHIQ